MSKGLAFILLIFMSLVAINWLFSISGSLLATSPVTIPSVAYGQDVTVNQTGGGSGIVGVIDVSFFTPTGDGKSDLTQGYGYTPDGYLYMHGFHNGIDIAAPFGMPVYSPIGGTILATVNQDTYCPHIAYGKYVAIDDRVNHYVLLFSHLGNFDVSPGEIISKGTLLGNVGPTGLETGPHLLFSMFEEQGFSTSTAHGCGPYPQGTDLDPLNYLGSLYN